MPQGRSSRLLYHDSRCPFAAEQKMLTYRYFRAPGWLPRGGRATAQSSFEPHREPPPSPGPQTVPAQLPARR